MIKLFRHIRRSVLTDDKFSLSKSRSLAGKYLFYAIGEIILVVIGILIALQLNQNAEDKKTDSTRQEYYLQLLEDLIKDKEFANETINLFEADKRAYNIYLDSYQNNELKPIQVYENLMTLSIYSTTLSFNSNTIESLRSSGEIILIPLEIRNKLIDLLRFQDKILKNVQLNDTGKNNMVQELGIYRGASTLAGRLENQPQLKSYLELDQHLPQIILGLDAVHKWKDFSQNDSMIHLRLLVNEIEAVIELIDIEIKKYNS